MLNVTSAREAGSSRHFPPRLFRLGRWRVQPMLLHELPPSRYQIPPQNATEPLPSGILPPPHFRPHIAEENLPMWSKNGADLGPAWPKIRAKQLHKESRCQFTAEGRRCAEPATEVDHRHPRSLGGTDHESNLQSLCTFHHGQKTSAEGIAAWTAKKAEIAEQFNFNEEHPFAAMFPTSPKETA